MKHGKEFVKLLHMEMPLSTVAKPKGKLESAKVLVFPRTTKTSSIGLVDKEVTD